MLLFLSLLALVAQPAAAASPDLVGSSSRSGRLPRASSADVGIAALDLNTGERSASRAIRRSRWRARSRLRSPRSICRRWTTAGRRSTIPSAASRSAALMARMLIFSDNHAADILFKDVGGPHAVHDWLHRQRHSRSSCRSDHRSAARRPAGSLGPRDSSTPKAMVELLRRIYRGELISQQSRNYLLDVMAKCETGKNRMKWLLPAGTPVEHKTGTLTGLADDVGFISMPDGHRLAVAIFTRGGSDRPHTIAEAARDIYDGFKSVFTWPFRASSFSAVGVASHRRFREDRPLFGSRSCRPLFEADFMADQTHRTIRARLKGARTFPLTQ